MNSKTSGLLITYAFMKPSCKKRIGNHSAWRHCRSNRLPYHYQVWGLNTIRPCALYSYRHSLIVACYCQLSRHGVQKLLISYKFSYFSSCRRLSHIRSVYVQYFCSLGLLVLYVNQYISEISETNSSFPWVVLLLLTDKFSQCAI